MAMVSTIVAGPDPATGAELWASTQYGGLSCPLAAAGGTVYQGSRAGVLALDTLPAPPSA
ncbi:PQQ-like beta-propeller repeat protein [Streptomyces sp. LS1784]|uniref:PQQ-like beta-propeller repeat protein n=1 Tax=Streptomyces sp. LS1784 TaxID=2851533 RepID=UPI001CCC7289|nr:PQQ-like beta-propeller repeat protein [Streptomyces sp. LS1784]